MALFGNLIGSGQGDKTQFNHLLATYGAWAASQEGEVNQPHDHSTIQLQFGHDRGQTGAPGFGAGNQRAAFDMGLQQQKTALGQLIELFIGGTEANQLVGEALLQLFGLFGADPFTQATQGRQTDVDEVAGMIVAVIFRFTEAGGRILLQQGQRFMQLVLIRQVAEGGLPKLLLELTHAGTRLALAAVHLQQHVAEYPDQEGGDGGKPQVAGSLLGQLLLLLPQIIDISLQLGPQVVVAELFVFGHVSDQGRSLGLDGKLLVMAQRL